MELVDREDIPRSKRESMYPWDEWCAVLENGQAVKLSRADMPEQSGAYKQWDSPSKRGMALRGTANFRGLHTASRGDYIYLWRK